MTLFAAKAATDALWIGPHNTFTRNGLVLNDRSALDCYWVEDPTGFDSPDRRAGETENVQEDGSLPDLGYFNSRTMTLTGYIQAGTYTKLVQMSRALLNCMLGHVERPLLISSYVDLLTMPDVTINCRPTEKPTIATAITRDDQSGVFKRNFTLSLRASDPVFLWVGEQSRTLTPTSVAALGRSYDRTYDLAYDVYMDASGSPTSAGSSLTVRNAGNYKATPAITFTGYMLNPTLINNTNGYRIKLNGAIAAGEFISIDVKSGKIVDGLGNSRASQWDPVSDWMVLEGVVDWVTGEPLSGYNELVLLLADFDSSAQVALTWHHTSV